jgi:hypothetical protein
MLGTVECKKYDAPLRGKAALGVAWCPKIQRVEGEEVKKVEEVKEVQEAEEQALN